MKRLLVLLMFACPFVDAQIIGGRGVQNTPFTNRVKDSTYVVNRIKHRALVFADGRRIVYREIKKGHWVIVEGKRK